MKVLQRSEIEERVAALPVKDILTAIEAAFIAYSNGTSQVPPVGHLGFDDPPGDVHIKYGHILGDPYYVIKIASGFYQNYGLGLPNSNGMMMAFDASTGMPVCLLQDEGYLTDLRTAFAGAVAAKCLGPSNIDCIGIVGTGIQARFQLRALASVSDCRRVSIFGRDTEKVQRYISEMQAEGYQVEPSQDLAELCSTCNLIVTTTPSNEPLLHAEHIRPGTHITAMGSDTPGKQELDPQILAMADQVGVDSIEQCAEQGELCHLLSRGMQTANVEEIGNLLANQYVRAPNDITVADLTGIATQDIKIASLVL